MMGTPFDMEGLMSMDWFKGKSTGNHTWIMGFSCKISLKPIH
jgi:hypothetical protein